ncbi:MAG: B12-binding domain-containing radical SAM protein [Acidobacteria bacterium]|nr:B12-binding domain-containing radical SAM protein [Acidobacteriota bacterium]
MNILLYSPDNGVTRNFMPHLWMFLLKALTPVEHEVFLIDGNAQPMTEDELAQFVRVQDIRLVGMSAMTRMAARAYRMADAVRSVRTKVVFGGPHVTEVPDEPLGRSGEPRHADVIAIGEADYTWPRIVADAAAGNLQEIYQPTDDNGREVKPSLRDYPVIPWDSIDLEQFNLIRKLPGPIRTVLKQKTSHWNSLYVVPVESGRGCPYGCDFCTVTGFFGDAIRFRSNQSVVDELLRLKQRGRKESGTVAAFFIDDNFAINVKRTKSLLCDIIAHDAVLPWVAQISINLLKDEELLDLIAASGGRWIFVGLESVDAANLSSVRKSFNKPADYKLALDRLAQRGIYAITSFIFGMDGDTTGVARRTGEVIKTWPPGLPVFGLMTPYPATPLYDRLLKAGRLTRPQHWLDFHPFRMAFTPEKISITGAEAEVREAWTRSYSPQANEEALRRISERPFHERAVMFFARLAFRGIYFPQIRPRQWLFLLWRNRRMLCSLCFEALRHARARRSRRHSKRDGAPFPAQEVPVIKHNSDTAAA